MTHTATRVPAGPGETVNAGTRPNWAETATPESTHAAVAWLERAQSPHATLEALAVALSHGLRGTPLSGQLLLSAARGRQPLTLTHLVQSASRSSGDRRSDLFASLAEAYPDDEPLWDAVADALGDWLTEPHTMGLPRTLDRLTGQSRTISADAAQTLLLSRDTTAAALVLRCHTAGAAELTDQQLADIAHNATSEVATLMLATESVRRRLTDAALCGLLDRLTYTNAIHVTDAVLRDPHTSSRGAPAHEALLSKSARHVINDWVTGSLPTAPSPALARSVERKIAHMFWAPDREVDNVITTYAPAFTPESLERPGVVELLEAAPVAVAEEAETRPRRDNAFALLLDLRLAQAGAGPQAQALVYEVTQRLHPATLTEAVTIACALAASAATTVADPATAA